MNDSKTIKVVFICAGIIFVPVFIFGWDDYYYWTIILTLSLAILISAWLEGLARWKKEGPPKC